MATPLLALSKQVFPPTTATPEIRSEFTSFAWKSVSVGLVIFGICMVGCLWNSLKMKPAQRYFHHMVIVVLSMAFLSYAMTLGGYGYLSRSRHSDLLLGFRDEFAVHTVMPLYTLPPILHLINTTSGVFNTDGYGIIGSVIISSLYGIGGIYLPRKFLGVVVSIISVIFLCPFFFALLSTWSNSVKAAPQRVQNCVNLLRYVMLLTIFITVIVFDLACRMLISADLENAIYVIVDIIVYAAAPLYVVCNTDIIKDVYAREDFIRSTRYGSYTSSTSAENIVSDGSLPPVV